MDDLNVDEVYGGNMKAEDLTEPTTLVIVAVNTMEFEGKDKIVLSFKETQKRLILNVTRKDVIKKNLKSHFANDWIGKSITILPGKTRFGGKTVPCIVVKEEEAPPF